MHRPKPAAPAFGYYELHLNEVRPGRMADLRTAIRSGEALQPPPCADGPPLGIWESYSGPGATHCAWLFAWSRLGLDRTGAGPQPSDMERSDDPLFVRKHVSILRPSPAWSGIEDPAAWSAAGLHEVRFYQLGNHDPQAAHRVLGTVDLPFIEGRGARILGVFATWFGTAMNQAVVFAAWPDEAARRAALLAHRHDDGIRTARDAERRAGGRPLVRHVGVQLMVPVARDTGET